VRKLREQLVKVEIGVAVDEIGYHTQLPLAERPDKGEDCTISHLGIEEGKGKEGLAPGTSRKSLQGEVHKKGVRSHPPTTGHSAGNPRTSLPNRNSETREELQLLIALFHKQPSPGTQQSR
jgi:hypothetical protein